MKNEGKKLTIVGDGLARRDYTHVLDVVSANLLAMENDKVGDCEVFNIGTGINFSVLELADMIGGDIEHIPPRKGEAKETLADISKAKKNLGWKPQVNLKNVVAVLEPCK